ncbi:MAG: MmcQ/YjbR family DNA-binding protein [Gemmatimonadota bacterium]|nr:MmcQ/YjbR family DNA-binding protein [Gemmatimonadota bacterium]
MPQFRARKPEKRAPTLPIDRVRAICLALPEAHEVEAWSEPTFRVKNKIFAMYADSDNHHGAGRPCIWLKSTHLIQDMLIHEDSDRYFAPPYVGPKGWLGIRLDRRPSWPTITDLIRDAYLLTAPKRIAAKLG